MRRFVPALLAGLLLAAEVWAGPGTPLGRDRASGDWGGGRTRLAELGVDLHASYLAGFWSNLVGGFATGIRYQGYAAGGADLDLERLLGWAGASFHLSVHSYHGRQPSANLVGLFPTNTLSGYEGARSLRFYDLYLEQALWDGRFRIRLGQLAMDDEFFQSAAAADLRNGTFGDFTYDADAQLTSFHPLAAPGVVAEVRVTPHLDVRVGATVADVGVDENSNRGFDWSFDHGASLLGEIEWHGAPVDRPATLRVGILGTTRDGRDFGDGRHNDGGFGLLAGIDQALWLDAAGDARLTGFVRSGYSPLPERAFAHWFVQAGFRLAGPLPGRDEDALSVGFALTALADDYLASLAASGERAAGRERLLEVTYRAELLPWLHLQPSLQCVFKPHFSRRTALAFGMNVVIHL